MTKPSNISGIEKATARTWSEWVTWLDGIGAATLPHPEIANRLTGELQGKVESPEWWAQNVTVAYEQHIGRRQPGQQNDGTYEMSVTRTLAGTKEDVLALWVEAHGEAKTFKGKAVRDVRTSVTPVRLYWRCELEDGSSLSVSTEQKEAAKAMIVITHTKLNSENAKDEWRLYWKELISRL